jgi:hypothetical protein
VDDPKLILSILTLIVAMVSVAATFIYFRKSRKYKELSYEILPTLALVSIGQQVRDRVEIKYKAGDGETDDLEIEDLKGVAITIRNTGTEAVNCRSKDFEDDDPQIPVTLDFGQHAQILGDPSTETNPKGRKVGVKKDPQAPGNVLMDTFLLNPKETVTISTFLTNFSEGHPSVDWHIDGVRPPREVGRAAGNQAITDSQAAQALTDRIWLIVLGTFSLLLLVVAIALLFTAIWPSHTAENASQILLTAFTTIAGILAGFISGRASVEAR